MLTLLCEPTMKIFYPRNTSGSGQTVASSLEMGRSVNTSNKRNMVIIDSDEDDVLEMERPPTPPHRTYTATANMNRVSTRPLTGTDDLVCCEDFSVSKPTVHSDSKILTPENGKRLSLSQLSSRGIIKCPICMETIQQFEKEGRQIMVTRCGHIFCSACIRESVKVQRKCPTCRKPINLRGGFHELFIS